MAASLNKYGISSADASYSLILSGTYTSGTWYNVIDMDDLGDGNYVIYVYASTYSAGASQYSAQSLSEPLYWHSGQSNSGNRSLLTFGAFMGHAPNSYQDPNSMFEFGIKHNFGGTNTKAQIKFSTTLTGLTTSEGYKFEIRAYRL